MAAALYWVNEWESRLDLPEKGGHRVRSEVFGCGVKNVLYTIFDIYNIHNRGKNYRVFGSHYSLFQLARPKFIWNSIFMHKRQSLE